MKNKYYTYVVKLCNLNVNKLEKVKGLIWYADGYHAGTQEDFQAFIKIHKGAKLVFTFDAIKPTQLFKLSENLNTSNARRVNVERRN